MLILEKEGRGDLVGCMEGDGGSQSWGLASCNGLEGQNGYVVGQDSKEGRSVEENISFLQGMPYHH